MIDNYVRLSKQLFRTRLPLAEACWQLDINSQEIDPQLLEVESCDNCGFWDKEKFIHKEKDGTRYCYACKDIESLRF